LSKEVHFYSKVFNAEFNLFNVNGFNHKPNFFDVPGSSSRHYKFLVKINPSDTRLWKKGFLEIKADIKKEKWVFDLIPKLPEEWKIYSKPNFFMNVKKKRA